MRVHLTCRSWRGWSHARMWRISASSQPRSDELETSQIIAEPDNAYYQPIDHQLKIFTKSSDNISVLPTSSGCSAMSRLRVLRWVRGCLVWWVRGRGLSTSACNMFLVINLSPDQSLSAYSKNYTVCVRSLAGPVHGRWFVTASSRIIIDIHMRIHPQVQNTRTVLLYDQGSDECKVKARLN